ncbi:cytochrome b [Roseospira visakhapatnamensis]|uniref:Cytochrome b n=1 Tax=Roseospira visakhapatnamensis TaxID=390880 RepID=A0A7W6RA59_9PROT|nr:cytochrome b N-terminal domain-containing protein [Roseospira visakhapatnamensis]MBB4264645.1 quinol-cytochrome oxidoreductase complex cytochrome b subunit [Roseospira visakhapatnamensis]
MSTTPDPVWSNRAIKWFDRRLPLFTMMHKELIVYPTPRNINYWWNFGSLAGVALVIMILTGIFLAMFYTPHEDMAFASIERIMREVNYGWLIRFLHMNGASMFFAVVYIHILRGMYYGSYKAPRELLWIIGVVIYILMMAAAFLGYVLPWGQMSFWAATVITSLVTPLPFGETIAIWLWGGYSVDNDTLKRFFSLHYLVPFLIFAFVFLHLWALHTTKSNNPLGVEIKKPADTLPFHPYFTVKDSVTLGAFLFLLCYFVFFAPNYFNHSINYVMADPLVTPEHIVPEWYFLPFYAILRAIPDKLMGVVLMFAAILVWAALPWLDTSKVRSGRFRPTFRIFFWIFVADAVLLTYLGAMPAEGIYVTLGQFATAWYFIHFLVVLPILGKVEKTEPVPESISAAVSAEHQKEASA